MVPLVRELAGHVDAAEQEVVLVDGQGRLVESFGEQELEALVRQRGLSLNEAVVVADDLV